MMMKVTACCLGSSFFGLQGAIEDDDISVGFMGLLLVLVSVLWFFVLCLSQFFFRSQSLRLSVLPSSFVGYDSLSFYKAKISGNGRSPKCPVTDPLSAFNAEI
jgi:hypothetical protein